MKVQGSVLGHCITTILISFAFFLPRVVQAEDPAHFLQNRKLDEPGLQFEPQYLFLTTNQNFSRTGERVALPDDFSITRNYFDLSFAFATSSELTLFARASAVWQKTRSAVADANSEFAFSDQMIGFSEELTSHLSASRVWFQFEFNFPGLEPYVGDRSGDFTSALFWNLPLSHSFSLEWGAAYRYRNHGYSSSIPLGLRISKNENELGLSYALAARAEVSLKTDPGPDPEEDGLESEPGLAGGSSLIGARNPQHLSLFAEIAYRSHSSACYSLTVSTPVMGSSAPSAVTLAAAASFFFHQASASSSPPTETESKQTLSGATDLAEIPSVHYDLEAKISGMNDQLFLLKIDRGSRDEIKSGQSFDIFSETNLIARARVISVKDDEAALNVIEYYQDHSIEMGFVTKRIVSKRLN